MEELFATKIRINELLTIRDFEIPLSDTEKKHLIITGKNGSGKTTFLNELKEYLNNIQNGKISNYTDLEKSKKEHEEYEKLITPDTSEDRIRQIKNQIASIKHWLLSFGQTRINFNDVFAVRERFITGDFIISFFGAKRNTILKTPTGINKVDIKPVYQIEEKAGFDFIQYIVNLKADQSFAKDDNDIINAGKIDDWFQQFEEKILEIFDAKDAKLQFDRKSYNFNIIEPNKKPYNLNQLSDGYSAILSIVTELIMRMEEHKTKNYDVQGIVLIDEIETHLHIELQKKVLPFLISFFPKIQFIVTTHSPFVINSIDSAVICDLEKKIVTSDLSGYSYDAIVESYFDSDKYSTILKERIAEYEQLMSKDKLNDLEQANLQELKDYFDKIPKFFSEELVVKLQQIKLKNLKKKA